MKKNKSNDVEVCQVECIHHDVVERAKKVSLDRITADKLAQTFKALGDINRIQMINILGKEEMCVCDLAAVLEMSISAVSHQLRVLRNLSLVKYRRKGKMVYYSLDDEHIQNLFAEGLLHVNHS